MHENWKNPLDWTLSTWAMAIGVGVVGGIINNFTRMKKEKVWGWRFFIECVLDAIVSGFVSLIVFMALMSFDYPITLCSAIAGVAGHRAARLIFLVERVTDLEIEKIEKKFNDDGNNT